MFHGVDDHVLGTPPREGGTDGHEEAEATLRAVVSYDFSLGRGVGLRRTGRLTCGATGASGPLPRSPSSPRLRNRGCSSSTLGPGSLGTHSRNTPSHNHASVLFRYWGGERTEIFRIFFHLEGRELDHFLWPRLRASWSLGCHQIGGALPPSQELYEFRRNVSQGPWRKLVPQHVGFDHQSIRG